MRKTLTAAAATLLVASLVAAATGARVHCVIFGNGGGWATSTHHTALAAVGQPSVEAVASAHHRLTPGASWCETDAVTAAPGSDAAASVLRLHRNAPNPFNPSTTITFDVPHATSQLTLRIYDVGGRLVRVLVDGPQPGGRQQVVWNGRDDSGASVATGVYLYQIETEGQRITRKMALVK